MAKLNLDTVDFNAIKDIMDDEIKEAIQDELAPCNIQVFMEIGRASCRERV